MSDLNYKDEIIFSQQYNISGVENPFSRKLSNFFDYYFKDYSMNKIKRTSEFTNWIFVAHKGDEIIGAIKGDIMWGVIHIDLLIVIPEYRKLGVGTKLYNLAIEKAKKEDCKLATVETFDFQAPDYWKSKGFNVDFIRSGYETNQLYFLSKSLL
jgi:ribosomal protein S18 acetylase RimI-like enzyme